jgi:CheY-like chemotaxis protein
MDVIDSPSLRDARILLLEDDALISIDAEDMLKGLGAREVFQTHTVEAAEAVLAREAIDGAVLDVIIGHGRCDDFARLLLARAIPFVFASGYGDRATLPEDLQHVPRVEKPYTGEALLAALRSVGLGR